MYYKIEKWCKDNKVFINLKNFKWKEYFQQFIALFNIDKTIQCIYCQCTVNYMPILYSIDINFDIAISNFVGIANISGISNYTEAQNEADKEGANNNSQGSASNNKDNNKREDNNNKEDISSVRTQGGQ